MKATADEAAAKAKSDEQITTLTATVKEREATIAELRAEVTDLGGEPLAIQRKQEAAIRAAKQRLASDAKLLQAAGEDAVAVVTAEVEKIEVSP